jgi:RNA polymerase subunit RPABC4/transcription elongation factor Spt4
MHTKQYQACFQCHVFLNADGKVVPMKPQETTS